MNWDFILGFVMGANVFASFVLMLMYRRGMLSPKYPDWM